MNHLAILGATGSIGASALNVIARHPERLRVTVLTAGRQVDALLALCRAHAPDHAVIADQDGYTRLRDGLRAAGLRTQAHAGAAAIAELAASDACDTVIAAIVGAAGLPSTLSAARAGKRLLLANKESLVLAGELLIKAAQHSGATIIPIDSEHNAVFQCLQEAGQAQTRESQSQNQNQDQGQDPAADSAIDVPGSRLLGSQRLIQKITLTASGGPFRGWNRAQLADVTPEQAIAHPNWSMGPKISVDSATLMNKGLEVIEAHHLFALPAERLEVLVHPQSLVHALVEFIDGSTLAQLGLPDMRTALAVGLFWPERGVSGVGGLDLGAQGRLDFAPPDLETFPCLRLAYDALREGGGAPAILNAANEVAVAAFLQGRIGFLDIPETIQAALEAVPANLSGSLQALLEADAQARRVAEQVTADRQPG